MACRRRSACRSPIADALVIDIAGDASVQMCMQEMSTAVQYNLPIKIFILNNQYMGMVRQWQQLLHGNRLSHSYTEALPDFVKLAEAYGAHEDVGIRAKSRQRAGRRDPGDDRRRRPVIFDCRVANLANCFPMIPSGKAHNEMLLGEGLGLVHTALATLVMFAIIGRAGASFFGQINLLVPVAGVLWSAALLAERPGFNALAALALIVLGIVIARGGLGLRGRSGGVAKEGTVGS
jgi:hypothetical protein